MRTYKDISRPDYTPERITDLKADEIFVFGSNLEGMMGAEMLGRAAKRERQEAEKRRYDSLYWQESIRDKNPRHDFDYDNIDD